MPPRDISFDYRNLAGYIEVLAFGTAKKKKIPKRSDLINLIIKRFYHLIKKKEALDSFNQLNYFFIIKPIY